MQLHVIERNTNWFTPEDPYNTNGKPRSYPVALTQGHHTAFLTDNFEEIKKNLKKMNIEYYEAKMTRAGGNYQLWFYDPDGNGIEILQPRNPTAIKSKL